ncbi:MAG: sigma-70 family RNA polymerase sigma factor [Acidobacteria bacterium]|nr:sigma-70 family RNA polymerase sigma factor [Acidobacteriota bacterium]
MGRSSSVNVSGEDRMMSAAVVDQLCSDNTALAGDASLEAHLAERICAGDRTAFEQLVITYQAGVYGLLYRLVGDAEEARDLAQETFLKVYQKIDRFRGESSLKTWVYRIATRLASNHRRWWFRRRCHRTVSIDDPGNGDCRSVVETLADEHPDSEQVLIGREWEAELTRALRRVKPAYRAAVILRDIEGCSYEEIAAVLRISAGTVKSRIARGREMLRKEWVKNHLETPDD